MLSGYKADQEREKTAQLKKVIKEIAQKQTEAGKYPNACPLCGGDLAVNHDGNVAAGYCFGCNRVETVRNIYLQDDDWA